MLVSVPNTPEAKEAAIAATIPQTATVSGTSLNYAVNTATPVIEVDSSNFYAVSNGVWFVAGSALGPWTVATAVPGIIYTIPVSSPIHYVTYVQIYSYTPTSVVVGYTPGYMGVAISPDGTVVYGTGYVYPAYVGNAVAWNNGDHYAGHDGSVYRHTADNGWQQHTSNGWQSTQPGGDLGNDLNRQQGARDLGEQRFGGGGFHGGFRR